MTHPAYPLTNAHIHLPPNFSAFGGVAEAVNAANVQKVCVLGVSNYYDFSVYEPFAREAGQAGVLPLFGLEIITLDTALQAAGVKVNDPGNPGKMYICGKGITHFAPLSPEAQELLEPIRSGDAQRMAQMVARLGELLRGAGVTDIPTVDGVKERIAASHSCPVEWVFLQERHVARAVQEAVFAQGQGEDRAEVLMRLFGVASKNADDAGTVQNEVRSYLMKAGRKAYVDEAFVGFDHAARLVYALGGMVCYPTLADGANPICPYEADLPALIADLKRRGVAMAEFIPVRNEVSVLTRYVLALRDAGFPVTAGTEHNTPDNIALAPTCAGGHPLPPEVARIFWEGACVVAAHQHERAQNRPGFVDANGNPNPAYATADSRIRAFAQIGESVIGAA